MLAPRALPAGRLCGRNSHIYLLAGPYPAEYRYADDAVLPEELERLCCSWTSGKLDLRADRRTIVEGFHATVVLPRYRALFEELAADGCADSRRGTHSA